MKFFDEMIFEWTSRIDTRQKKGKTHLGARTTTLLKIGASAVSPQSLVEFANPVYLWLNSHGSVNRRQNVWGVR